jgi:acetolactate synthase-1/2/3 large subunit
MHPGWVVQVAELIAEALVRLGVRHVFGVGGANIEDMFLAVQRRRPQIRAIACKHEHGAGTAADAYARLGGGFGVVFVTSGGGAMNLVHAMAEASASGVGCLAVLGEPPLALQGHGAFQDTSGQAGGVDAFSVYRALTAECARPRSPEEICPWLERWASSVALGADAPRVLLLAKDLQQADVAIPVGFWERFAEAKRARHRVMRDLDPIVRALGTLPVAIVAGADVARADARAELAQLADVLNAQVAVAPDARDAFDNGDPRFVGVIGAMGHPSALRALAGATVLLVVGSRLPILARQGLEGLLSEKLVLSVGRELPFVKCAVHLPVEGDLRRELRALAENLARTRPASVRPAAAFGAAVPSVEREPSRRFGVQAVLQLISDALPEDASVLIDAGNTGAAAIHYLAAPRRGRWLVAMGMAGMGYTFGAALGAALARGRRVFVIAGDGAFFMQGLEVHTAVEHDLPITYVVLDNAAHGMCLVREQLLLGENSGYNVFRRSQLGAGLKQMFPGLPAFDCGDAEQLAQALGSARESSGPAFVSAQLLEVEVPPFAAFQKLQPQGTPVARGGRA